MVTSNNTSNKASEDSGMGDVRPVVPPPERAGDAGWTSEVEVLNAARARALAMGGPVKVDRQHELGKLTIRERLALLFDAGSFEELGILADRQGSGAGINESYAAADGIVIGHGEIDGRVACVLGNDFTVLGGSDGQTGRRKRARITELAGKMRCPLVYLIDGAGARAQESILDSWPGGEGLTNTLSLSGIVPQVAVIMGPAAGTPALHVPACDFRVMVKGTGMVAAGGPAVVQEGMGLKLSKEDLGGWSVVGHKSGLVHQGTESDAECIAAAKTYLSYLPSSCWEAPPCIESFDDPWRQDEQLLSLVPRDRKRAYDMKRLFRHVADRDSVFEIQPEYGRALVTALTRMDGRTVAMIGNQPMVNAGALGVDEAEKVAHFLAVCNSFHIPIVFFSDIPGMMIGPDAEAGGVLQKAMRAAYAIAYMRVPTIAVCIRKAYGMGAVAMSGPGQGQLGTFAWPSAEFGALPLEGGVRAGYVTEIRNSEDPAATIAALTERVSATTSNVWRAASVYNFDDIIDPRETRSRIVRLLRRAPQPTVGPWQHQGIAP